MVSLIFLLSNFAKLIDLATKKCTKSAVYCVLQKGEIEVKNTRKREKYTKNAKMTKLLIQRRFCNKKEIVLFLEIEKLCPQKKSYYG